MIELKHLNHLVALAEERHFARAAGRVHLSQPAFSRSIQTIEHNLGMRLFDRENGDVRPTPAGSFLIGRARQLLFDARCVQRDVELYSGAQLGDLAFGVGPFPAATLVHHVLTELRRQHPNVCIRVQGSNWELLVDRLHKEDIEFFVADVRSFPKDLLLKVEPLGRQYGRFYVRAEHPLSASCTLSELWAYGVAATRLPTSLKAALAQLLALPLGQEPELALECDDVQILRAVAVSTDTVLAVTDVAAQNDVESGVLRAITVTNLPPLFAEMGIVSLRNRTPSPMAQRAMESFKRVAARVNA